MDDCISLRALDYAREVVARLKLETKWRALPDGKDNFVFMLIEPVVKKVLEWMNQSITLHSDEQELLTESQLQVPCRCLFQS